MPLPRRRATELEDEPTLGQPVNAAWEFKDVSLGAFLQQLHEQRILDTALDAMSMNIDGDSTTFHVSRQAAVAGKVAFPIPGDEPLEECSPSPGPERDWRIGSKRQPGTQVGRKCHATSTMIIRWRKTVNRRRGFERGAKIRHHFPVTPCPRQLRSAVDSPNARLDARSWRWTVERSRSMNEMNHIGDIPLFSVP